MVRWGWLQTEALKAVPGKLRLVRGRFLLCSA